LVIKRLRNVSFPRRHPRSSLLSRYLEDDLDARSRHTLESHLGDCPRCRRELASIASTLRALGWLEDHPPSGLSDSIIAALRTETPPAVPVGKRSQAAAGVSALTLVADSGEVPAGGRTLKRWPTEIRSALRWCLQPPRLSLTIPIALAAGVVLSLVNMGGMLMHGRIDLGVCVSCAVDFLVPFLALNLGLLMLLWAPRRRYRQPESRFWRPPR
jgi:anti-sigma factor RsiW